MGDFLANFTQKVSRIQISLIAYKVYNKQLHPRMKTILKNNVAALYYRALDK